MDYNEFELLFWKVIHNKFIFMFIIDKLNLFKYGVFKNQSIISVEWMLNNNQIELLKYKVKRNEYLTFGNINLLFRESGYRSNDESSNFIERRKNEIYKTIKDDQEFYGYLFKNYSIHFQNDFSDKLAMEKLIDKLIKFNNVGALIQVLTNFKKFEIKIKNEHLLLAFEYNSFNVAEYLYCTYGSDGKNNFKISSNLYWNLVKKGIPLKKDQFLNAKYGNPIDWRLVNLKIQFLINVLKVKPPESKNDIKELCFMVTENIDSITLRDLIDSCITISYLSKPLKPFLKYLNQYIKDNTTSLYYRHYSKEWIQLYINQDKSKPLSIKLINQYKSCFTNEQLSNNLINFKYDEIIKKLIQMILTYIGISSGYFQNFIFYYIVFSGSNLQLTNLNFSNYITLSIIKFTKEIDIKLQYLKSLKGSLIMPEEDMNHFILCKMLLVHFVETNDLICLEYTLSKLVKYDQDIFDHVNSLETLNSIYNYSPDLFLQHFNLPLLIGKNFKLISIFKSNYKQLYNQLFNDQLSNIVNQLKSTSTSTNGDFIYDNFSQFENTDVFKYIIPKRSESILNRPLKYYQFEFFYKFSKFFYHISLNSNNNIFNVNPELKSSERMFIYNYYSGNLNKVFENGSKLNQIQPMYFFKNCKPLLSKIAKHGDLDSLSLILSNYFPLSTSNIDQIYNLDTLFVYASFLGQVSIFKFIQKEYPFLLFTHNTIIYGKCYKYSFSNQHNEMIQFLNQLQ